MSVIYINSYQFAAPAGPTDPYFANVPLLLPGDGVNGGNNTTFVDSSTNNHAITVYGNAQQVGVSPFGSGGSGAFDGSGDYLGISTSSDFAFGTSDFTVEMWLYRIGGGQQHLYEGRRTSVTGKLLIFLNSSNQLSAYVNGVVVISSSTVLAANQWVHVAYCRSAGTSRLFADGVQVGSSYTDTTNYLAPTDFLSIGTNDVSTGSYLNGYIDDLRITKGVARYTSNFTPPTAPLTADANTSLLLRFDNLDIIDSSSTPKAITAFGNAQISTAQSKFGGSSLAFDGTGDYLTTPYLTSAFDWWTTDFTIEMWVYASSWTNWSATSYGTITRTVGNLDPFSGANYWSFGPDAAGRVKLYYYNGSEQHNIYSTAVLATSQWHHIAASKDSSGVRLFINGVNNDGVFSINGTPQSSAAVPFTIAQYNGIGITGYIDDLRITKGVARYTSNFTPPTQPFPNV